MTQLSPTARTELGRHKERAQSEREALFDVLDSALVCHLSVVLDGAPFVVPTGFGHDRQTLFLHGSTGAQSLRAGDGMPVCVAVTVLDGIIYARSVFNHSMNYRAAVIHGVARSLSGDEKLHGLRMITDHLTPGSWEHARLPNKRELAKTSVLALDLHESSVKLRAGGPEDDEADLDLPVWAGVLPVRQVFGQPQPDELLPAATPVPAHVENR